MNVFKIVWDVVECKVNLAFFDNHLPLSNMLPLQSGPLGKLFSW